LQQPTPVCANAVTKRGRIGVHRLPRHAARVQRRLGCLAELEQAGVLDQPLAGLLFERAPAPVSLFRELDPLRLGIREPEDARPTVARATLVIELVLLADDDLVTVARERRRGREPVDPSADDDHTHTVILA
jgi:hypothetical protein